MGAHNRPQLSRVESLPNDEQKFDGSATWWPRLLTVAQAVEYSGLTDGKIRDLVSAREISTLDRGASGRGHIHIVRESLDAWIERNATPVDPFNISGLTVNQIREREGYPLDADNGIKFDGDPLFS